MTGERSQETFRCHSARPMLPTKSGMIQPNTPFQATKFLKRTKYSSQRVANGETVLLVLLDLSAGPTPSSSCSYANSGMKCVHASSCCYHNLEHSVSVRLLVLVELSHEDKPAAVIRHNYIFKTGKHVCKIT